MTNYFNLCKYIENNFKGSKMKNSVLIPVALAFTAVAGMFITLGSGVIIDKATDAITKPVAGIKEPSEIVAESIQIDCSKKMPKFGVNEICEPEILLGQYSEPAQQP